MAFHVISLEPGFDVVLDRRAGGGVVHELLQVDHAERVAQRLFELLVVGGIEFDGVDVALDCVEGVVEEFRGLVLAGLAEPFFGFCGDLEFHPIAQEWGDRIAEEGDVFVGGAGLFQFGCARFDSFGHHGIGVLERLGVLLAVCEVLVELLVDDAVHHVGEHLVEGEGRDLRVRRRILLACVIEDHLELRGQFLLPEAGALVQTRLGEFHELRAEGGVGLHTRVGGVCEFFADARVEAFASAYGV